MSSRVVPPLTRCRLAWALLSLVTVVSVSPARAEVELSESSLQWVPADAAFYFSLMRNKEQYDAIVNSRAVGQVPDAGHQCQPCPAAVESQSADRRHPAPQYRPPPCLRDPPRFFPLLRFGDEPGSEVHVP